MSRGALIVLEGLDRTGKTTQCKQLVQALLNKGHKAEMMIFPNRKTEIGKTISNYLSSNVELEDQAIHLLFSANRWEMVPKMKELLSSGTTLIVDRYSFSGVAFSYAKKHLDLKWCMRPEQGLPKPDKVLFLDLPVEEIAKRGGFGDERYEKLDFQTTVKEVYHKIKEDFWEVIDADASIDDLSQVLLDKVLKVVEESPKGELELLWHPELPSSIN